jgi:hypothetical protein
MDVMDLSDLSLDRVLGPDSQRPVPSSVPLARHSHTAAWTTRYMPQRLQRCADMSPAMASGALLGR